MVELIKQWAEWCAVVVEALGIVVITGAALYAFVWAGWRFLVRRGSGDVFPAIRQRLGRGILLGLEFLVAADIIYTVAVEFTLETVGLLGLIVLIRTFLSFALEVELNGRWPWREARAEAESDRGNAGEG